MSEGGAPRRAVIYARVSSQEQEREGFSIPAQLELLRSYATSNGLQVAKEFIDVETAKRAGRTSFGEMVGYLKRHPECRVVLVEKTDRLYRNIRDWVTVDELGASIHFAKEGTVVSPESHSSEKFMHGIKVLMAKNYVDNLGEEAKKGMVQKARQGIYPSRAPVGYANVTGPDGKKTIEPHPSEAPVVRELFERYATGRLSLDDVTALASDLGLRNRRSGKPLARGTIHKILGTLTYTGSFVWDGTEYAGVYEPIVSRELYDAVQDVFGGRYQQKRSSEGRHPFMLSGVVTCEHCGCALVGESKKGGRYTYYHCSGMRGPCPKPYIREEKLVDAYAAQLERLHFDDEILAWLLTAVRESVADETKTRAETRSRLEGQRARLSKRLDALLVAKLDGEVDKAAYDRHAATWRAEVAEIDERLVAIESARAIHSDDAVGILELCAKAREHFESSSSARQRRLVEIVYSNSVYGESGLTVEMREPFASMALTAAQVREAPDRKSGSTDQSLGWLPEVDATRTLVLPTSREAARAGRAAAAWLREAA